MKAKHPVTDILQAVMLAGSSFPNQFDDHVELLQDLALDGQIHPLAILQNLTCIVEYIRKYL
jgi:hypothetical protein